MRHVRLTLALGTAIAILFSGSQIGLRRDIDVEVLILGAGYGGGICGMRHDQRRDLTRYARQRLSNGTRSSENQYTEDGDTYVTLFAFRVKRSWAASEHGWEAAGCASIAGAIRYPGSRYPGSE